MESQCYGATSNPAVFNTIPPQPLHYHHGSPHSTPLLQHGHHTPHHSNTTRCDDGPAAGYVDECGAAEHCGYIWPHTIPICTSHHTTPVASHYSTPLKEIQGETCYMLIQ